MTVKRWNNWCGVTHGHRMQEQPGGLYVTFDDYDALAAERDALRQSIDAFLTPADQPRCFRCGHAKHAGDCVNTAPDQPTGGVE